MSQGGHLKACEPSGFFIFGNISSELSYINDYFQISTPLVDERSATYLNTMNFFFIYNNFFYRDFGNKTRTIRKTNICKRPVHFRIFGHICFFQISKHL